MDRKRYAIIPALVALLISAGSCESIIEFKGTEVDPKIVIYSLLEPDSLVAVSVAVSHAVFEERYEPKQITNAVVRLYRDSELLETLAYTPGTPMPGYSPDNPFSRYTSQVNKPQYGSSYRIEVEVPGYRMASGEASLPEPVGIISIDTSHVVNALEEWIENRLIVKVRFRDPPGQENYYRASAASLFGSYPGNRGEPYSPLIPITVSSADLSYAFNNEPLIAPKQDEDIFGMYLQNTYNLFTDELISGKEYGLSMETHFYLPDTTFYEFAHTYIRLHTITRDLFLYLQSLSAHKQTSDNFLAEPVLVFTNISNGLGIVGAVSTSTATLRIGKYPVEGVEYDYRNIFW